MSYKYIARPCKNCEVIDCCFKGHENNFEVCEDYTTTNGDMMKAMFPQYRYEEITYKICTSEDEWEVSSKKVRMHSEQIVDFESDWWNAPYRKE